MVGALHGHQLNSIPLLVTKRSPTIRKQVTISYTEDDVLEGDGWTPPWPFIEKVNPDSSFLPHIPLLVTKWSPTFEAAKKLL